MKMLSLLVILTFLILGSTGQQSTFIYIDYSQCWLQVLEADNSSSFQLVFCQYQTDQDPMNTSSWNQCTRHCCDSSKTSSQERSSLDECQQYQRAQYLISVCLISIIVGGLPCWIVLITNCIKCRQARMAQPQLDPAPINNQAPSQQVIVSHQEQDDHFKGVNWQQSKPTNLEPCPICLDINSNLELSKCKHMIHIKCWRQWQKRNKSCVICRNPQVQDIRIFCERCYASSFTYKWQAIEKIEIIPKFQCPQCRKK